MTTETKPRELDMDRVNAIGEWIAFAHASERVLISQKLRELVQSVEDGANTLPSMIEDQHKELWAKFEPQIKAVVESFWEAVRGIERGDHVNAVSAPLHYRFPISIAGKDCVFGLPPNEHAMATDPGCTPRPWSPDPKE